MSKEKTLLKNTAIVSIGRIGTQLISFFLLPLYTALLTTEEYGIVDLMNTLTTILVAVVNLELEQGVFRFLIESRKDSKRKQQLISISIFSSLAQSLFCCIIFLLISPWVHSEYKVFLLFNMICTLFANLFLQISRGLGKNGQYSIGSFIVGACTVIFNVLFIAVFHWGAYGMIAASILANFLCSLYLFFILGLYKSVRLSMWNNKLFKELLYYSIPLIPNVINWWIINASDRLIISGMISLAANGIYSAANKFPAIIITVYNIFNITWTESASVNIDSEDKDSFFSKIYNLVISLFGSGCLLAIAVMPWIYPILINQQFFEGYWQIPLLIAGAFFNILVSFIGSIYVGKKLTREIAKTSLGAAVINIVINVLLIRVIGLFAASFSTLASYMIMFFYRYHDVQKYVRLKTNTKKLAVLLILSLIVFAFYYINQVWLNIISVLLCLACACLLNWDYFKSTMAMILKRQNN